MFDNEPRSQTQTPSDDVKFTLDDFQKAVSASTQKFKDEIFNHIQAGVKTELDSELMLAIINRELEKDGADMNAACSWPECDCYFPAGAAQPAICPRAKGTLKNEKMAHDILREAAKTFEERNAVYGSNYKMVGEVMVGLFPDGITLKTAHDHNRFQILMLMAVKLTRYTVNWEKGHHDSIRDNTVYSAMLEMIDGQT